MQEIHYALIKEGTVENIIVADEDFIKVIEEQYEGVVHLNPFYEALIFPSLGWKYSNGEFTNPASSENQA